MVAGFLLQVMAGALLQFVPVVTGGNVILSAVAVAGLAHPALTLGTPVLVAAFHRTPSLFALAACCLAAPVPADRRRRTCLDALRLAAIRCRRCVRPSDLLPTVLLCSPWCSTVVSMPTRSCLEAHQAGFGHGWALTLLAGVSRWCHVPDHAALSRVVTRYFVLLMLASLLLLSAGLAWERPDAMVAIRHRCCRRRRLRGRNPARVQARGASAKRRTVRFSISAAMASLIGACAGAALLLTVPLLAEFPQIPVVLGILLLVGGFWLRRLRHALTRSSPFWCGCTAAETAMA